MQVLFCFFFFLIFFFFDFQKQRFYPSSFGPPKKEEKSKGLSINVKKFLARKEEEERQRKIEAELKKEKLLQLRNQDNKAKKRVQVMLKRTKSYNKSVLEDAIDKVNTADTMNGNYYFVSILPCLFQLLNHCIP